MYLYCCLILSICQSQPIYQQIVRRQCCQVWGWVFSGFLFTVFTWGPPCHVVLSFTKAAKNATKYSKEIVFRFCIQKDISVWHQTDNKSYYWAHHSTPQPICLPLFMFKFWNPSPFTRKLSRQFVVFLRDLELRGHSGGLQVFPINSMRRLFNLWRKHFKGRNSEPTRLLLNNTWGGALHMSN